MDLCRRRQRRRHPGRDFAERRRRLLGHRIRERHRRNRQRGPPPHSIEAVVYGWARSSDVAQQIFRRKAAGIQTYGSTTVAVLSSSGVTYNIKFSRPTLVPVWIKVTDLETDANRFPVDGKDQIAQALIDYIGTM